MVEGGNQNRRNITQPLLVSLTSPLVGMPLHVLAEQSNDKLASCHEPKVFALYGFEDFKSFRSKAKCFHGKSFFSFMSEL